MIDKLIGAQGSRGNRRFFNENIRDCFEMLKVWEFRGMARDEKKKEMESVCGFVLFFLHQRNLSEYNCGSAL